MKQFLLIAALVIALVSCSKDDAQVLSAPVNKADTFFSRVKMYSDGRQPAVDTVFTLKLTTPAMYEQFSQQHGQVFEQSNTYIMVGVIWFKKL